MKKRIQLLVSAAMMLLVLTATTGCKEVMSSLDNPVSAYLQVKADSIVAFYGEPVSLKASTISTEPITYTSSDETIASVDQNGNVTAHKYGDVIITMTVAANEYYLGATKQVKVSARSKEMLVPLTIEAIEAGYINIYNYCNLTFMYSLNGADKVTITGNTYPIQVAAGDKVEFYGNNESYAPTSDTYIRTTNRACIYGNIMSLVDEKDFKNRTKLTSNYTFYRMFWNNPKLENHPTKDLVLPATKLAYYCYYGMFNGCTKLTKAPELPATELADGCYSSMFYNCDAMTEAPELPATKLKTYCYAWMFEDCDALTATPKLSSTQLAYGCYSGMFYSCDKLATASDLPATELPGDCYWRMFENCKELTSAPKILATELTSNSCYQMFVYCPKIKDAFVKFAYSGDYSPNMFYAKGDGVAEAVLHTTAANKASWESYFASWGLTNWTVKADY